MVQDKGTVTMEYQ